MPGGTPSTHLRGPVLHTGGIIGKPSLGASLSPWDGLAIGYPELGTYYFFRTFNFLCGADIPGATATITGSVSSTNLVSNLNPWTQTNTGTSVFNIDTATWPASLSVATGATSGNNAISALGLAAGNTGLSVAAKRYFFSAHLGFTSTATQTFFIGFIDTPSAVMTNTALSDGFGFWKASAATTLVPTSLSGGAGAGVIGSALTGSATTTITGAAHTINLHLQAEYVVGKALGFWATSGSISAEQGPATAATPALVGWTSTASALPLAATNPTFCFASQTNSAAAKTINVSQITVLIEY